MQEFLTRRAIVALSGSDLTERTVFPMRMHSLWPEKDIGREGDSGLGISPTTDDIVDYGSQV